MATNINSQNVIKNFIIRTIGGDRLTEKQAQKFGIDPNKFEAANIDDNDYVGLNEILTDNDLYQQFATMFEQQQEVKNQGKNKEEDKEEQVAVKDKNGAGV